MEKQNRLWTVYKHVSPSGKSYVGITSTTLEKRFLNGQGYRTSTVFAKAIKKYGWKNFKHIVLCEGLIQEEAEQVEINLISYYHLNDRRFGYNTATGGKINCGYTLTDEHKEKLRKAKEGRYFGADNPSAKAIICVTTGEKFVTAQDASVKMRCCRENIVTCCRGRLKSAGKHPITSEKLVWKYN